MNPYNDGEVELQREPNPRRVVDVDEVVMALCVVGIVVLVCLVASGVL